MWNLYLHSARYLSRTTFNPPRHRCSRLSSIPGAAIRQNVGLFKFDGSGDSNATFVRVQKPVVAGEGGENSELGDIAA
jgi:hypothetical protein